MPNFIDRWSFIWYLARNVSTFSPLMIFLGVNRLFLDWRRAQFAQMLAFFGAFRSILMVQKRFGEFYQVQISWLNYQVVFKTECGAVQDFQMENNAEKGQRDPPGPPLATPGPPLDLPKLPKSPKDPTVTPREAQYHPSTGHITCQRSQNNQIFNVIPKIAQYSQAPTGALLTLWCSLYWLEWTNRH